MSMTKYLDSKRSEMYKSDIERLTKRVLESCDLKDFLELESWVNKSPVSDFPKCHRYHLNFPGFSKSDADWVSPLLARRENVQHWDSLTITVMEEPLFSRTVPILLYYLRNRSIGKWIIELSLEFFIFSKLSTRIILHALDILKACPNVEYLDARQEVTYHPSKCTFPNIKRLGGWNIHDVAPYIRLCKQYPNLTEIPDLYSFADQPTFPFRNLTTYARELKHFDARQVKQHHPYLRALSLGEADFECFQALKDSGLCLQLESLHVRMSKETTTTDTVNLDTLFQAKDWPNLTSLYIGDYFMPCFRLGLPPSKLPNLHTFYVEVPPRQQNEPFKDQILSYTLEALGNPRLSCFQLDCYDGITTSQDYQKQVQQRLDDPKTNMLYLSFPRSFYKSMTKIKRLETWINYCLIKAAKRANKDSQIVTSLDELLKNFAQANELVPLHP